MVRACLAPLMALVLAIPPDAASLVARLGSGTPAEREEAARALKPWAESPCPPSTPPCVRPTPLSALASCPSGSVFRSGSWSDRRWSGLEGKDRPLAEVVRSIGKQAGFLLEISSQDSERLVTAREPLPIPFWQASSGSAWPTGDSISPTQAEAISRP